MRIADDFDKKSLLLLALLVLLITAMGLIWLHYDKELDRIENRRNEVKIPTKLKHEYLPYSTNVQLRYSRTAKNK